MISEYLNTELIISRVLTHNTSGEPLLTNEIKVFCKMYFENEIIMAPNQQTINSNGYIKTTTPMKNNDYFYYDDFKHRICKVQRIEDSFSDEVIYKAYFI